MNIILVDDEQYALNSLQKNIKELDIDAKVDVFDRSIYALEFAKKNKVDVAFFISSLLAGLSKYPLACKSIACGIYSE